MHIDEALITRVVEAYGFASKTEAVEMALREMDRKARFKALIRTGLGLSKEEMINAVDPDYDVAAMRVAEQPPKYGRS
ncbi:MAG: type II toxin-antitoxin system VapB family antitoxin [Verrucomicrobiales bacterium]